MMPKNFPLNNCPTQIGFISIRNFYLGHVIAFKYCRMNVLVNLVEFQLKQKL